MKKILLILLCLPMIGFGQNVTISKLLPYSIGKVKAYEEIEEREPISININFVDTEAEEED